jgi:hypothetical protein
MHKPTAKNPAGKAFTFPSQASPLGPAFSGLWHPRPTLVRRVRLTAAAPEPPLDAAAAAAEAACAMPDTLLGLGKVKVCGHPALHIS